MDDQSLKTPREPAAPNAASDEPPPPLPQTLDSLWGKVSALGREALAALGRPPGQPAAASKSGAPPGRPRRPRDGSGIGLVGKPLSDWKQAFRSSLGPPSEVYDQMERALLALEIPGLDISRVVWREGGLFSAEREYLRLSWRRIVFDICAAPFCNRYFVSCRQFLGPRTLTEMASLGESVTFAGMLAAFVSFCLLFFSPLLALAPIGLAGWNLVRALRRPRSPAELRELFLGMTILGANFESQRKLTHYEADTIAMFNGAIHDTLLDVLDELTKAKGLEPIPLGDRKPAMRGLVGER